MAAFADVAIATPGSWNADDEKLVSNILQPIIAYFKRTKDEPEDELKSTVKTLVSASGVTRPSTPSTASGKKDKKKKDSKEDRDKHVRFLGECCICGLEKRGNYDRLGFLCAGCRTVPVRMVQMADSTRVPRVRFSEHYVPSVQYPCRFEFLPDSQLPSRPNSRLTSAALGTYSLSIGASPHGSGEVGSMSASGPSSLHHPHHHHHHPHSQQHQQHHHHHQSPASSGGLPSIKSQPASAPAGTGTGFEDFKDIQPVMVTTTASAVEAVKHNGPPHVQTFAVGSSGASSSASLGTSHATPQQQQLQQQQQQPQLPARYSVTRIDVPAHLRNEMMSSVDSLRMLYHPSFLFNYAISRDLKRDVIWMVHETAMPIELRGALLQGQRCYELLRQISVAALSVLLFLKDFGRAHNDLRPENFFIDEQHRVKLRVGPFPVQDLPPPFSYEHSFFSDADRNPLLSTGSASSLGTLREHTADDPEPGTPSPTLSQSSLQRGKPHSFASKIDSYCLSRRTSRRHVAGQGSRDMFVLGVTLALIAYGDVDNLPLPNDEEVGSDPDELFLVEFIWRLLTGERSPDEALRDDYLTTVRLVDGAAVETIVLRVVAPPVPVEVQEQLIALTDAPSSPTKTPKKKVLSFGEGGDKEKSSSREQHESTSRSGSETAAASATTTSPVTVGGVGVSGISFEAPSPVSGGAAGKSRSASQDPLESSANNNNTAASTSARTRALKEKMMMKAKDMAEALNAASLRFRVNRWNTAVGKMVSFLNNFEVPPGEKEANAADPHLFQVVRTPTQLTFYSVRRDPRLLRARQIAGERQVASFSNALLASSSLSLASKNMPSAGTFEK